MVEFTPLEYATEDKSEERFDKSFDERFGGESHLDDFDDERDDRVGGRYSFGGLPRETSSSDPERIIKRHQAAKDKRKGEKMEQKRSTNLLGGLCAVLFVVTFVMGVGLIRSQDRIERMEGEMRQLTTAFRNHFTQEPSPPGPLAPAFAEAAQPPSTVAPDASYPYTEDSHADPTADASPLMGENPALIPPIPETYTIQPGDSLIAISLRFFGNTDMVADILELNGIEDPDMIVAGRTIALPRR
jgi:nucleoid-associated protein YgaU